MSVLTRYVRRQVERKGARWYGAGRGLLCSLQAQWMAEFTSTTSATPRCVPVLLGYAAYDYPLHFMHLDGRGAGVAGAGGSQRQGVQRLLPSSGAAARQLQRR
jgi:hypothetical protein